MTDYRDQHKVCIVRDADPGASRPHQLESNGGFLGWTGSVMAKVLHEAGIPWSTDEPLPEGVERIPDGTLLLRPHADLPANHQARNRDDGGWIKVPVKRSPLWREVRRVPKPMTERVPLLESLGRTHADDWPIRRIALLDGRPAAHDAVNNWCRPDADGMVEVLPNEDDQDGAA